MESTGPPVLFLGRGGRLVHTYTHTHIHTHTKIHTRPQYAKLPCAGLRERGVLLWILIWAWQREQCVSPHNLGARGRGGRSICVGHTYTSGNTHIWKHICTHKRADTNRKVRHIHAHMPTHTHTHTYNITHAYTHSHMQAISEGALWGGGAVTKSKVLIRSSGTLLTHPTPPRTDFLWNLFKSHLSSAFYCISHIPPSQSDKSPHTSQSQHHFLSILGDRQIWGIFTFKVIRETHFLLVFPLFSMSNNVHELSGLESSDTFTWQKHAAKIPGLTWNRKNYLSNTFITEPLSLLHT